MFGFLFVVWLILTLSWAATFFSKSAKAVFTATPKGLSTKRWCLAGAAVVSFFLFVATTPPPGNNSAPASDIGPTRSRAPVAEAPPHAAPAAAAPPDKDIGPKEPTSYKIVKIEDASHKALVKPLSEYTPQELTALPIDERRFCRVVVPATITTAQVEPTFRKIVQDLTSRDPDIDELYILMYSDEALADDAYDVGAATWAPGGKLGDVTPEIARSNSRLGYSLSAEIRPDLDEYLKARRSARMRFGLSDDTRRRIFKEFVAAEDRATKEAWSGYDAYVAHPEIEMPRSALRQFGDREDELKEKYRAKVRAKYHISQEVENEIEVEGTDKRWPMPPKGSRPKDKAR